MATQLEIINRALTKLGADRIGSGEIATPASKNAREAVHMYSIVRDAELRKNTWKFSIRRASMAYLLPDTLIPYSPVTGYVVGDIISTYYCLAPTTGNAPPNNEFWYNLVPEYGFTKAYLLPTDCLRVISVGEFFPGVFTDDYVNGDTAEYSIEGRFLLSNESSPLVIRYVTKIQDTAQYDTLFVEAFACRLAMELAEVITASDSKRERATREYRETMMEAIRTNAVEGPPQKLADDTWMLVRA